MDNRGTYENITGSQHSGVIVLFVVYFHMSYRIEGTKLAEERWLRHRTVASEVTHLASSSVPVVCSY